MSKRSKSDEWGTPPELYWRLYRAFGPFTLDAAASQKNHLLPAYRSKEDDTPSNYVSGHNVFLNPPYSRGHLARFARWALDEVCLQFAPSVCCLFPVRTSEGWWQRYVELPLECDDIAIYMREGMRFTVRTWRQLGEHFSIWTHFIPGRLQYLEDGRTTGPARFSSAVVVYQRGNPR